MKCVVKFSHLPFFTPSEATVLSMMILHQVSSYYVILSSSFAVST